MAKRGKRRFDTLGILHPDAAGIDVGASELYVAVSADRDPEPVRSFPTFTRDFHALADWLEQCGIDSVAGRPAELDDGNICHCTQGTGRDGLRPDIPTQHLSLRSWALSLPLSNI